MCGIAGWVAFQADLTTRRDIGEAMTATMSCRGPDASGTWVAPHAILGHRRLSIIDLEHGGQPMVVPTDAAHQVVITYSGEVYNFRELRAELTAAGHDFRTDSDTEVVLRAYLHWGEAFVDRLNGMYAFAVWDSRTEELLLVRDRIGIKPLYYRPTDDGVLFGSEPKAILAHPDVDAVVDLDGLREMFSIVKTPGHAVYQGMYEVRPGTLTKVSRTGLTSRRYWQLRSRPHSHDLETTVATVRDLLTDIVARQFYADVPVGTLLSGGLDSSAVTALAARHQETLGIAEPLPAFSVDFVGHEERFQADVQWEDPDIPFAVEVAKHVGAEHVTIVLDSDDVLDDGVRGATLRAQDLPISTGDMEYSLYLLCQQVRRRVTVALSGEAADELFGGYTWFHDPEAVHGDSFPWHHPFAKAGGIGALRDVGLWDRLDLGGYVDRRYREALAEVPRLPGETGLQARMREVSFLNLTRWENFLLDRKDRISMAVGLEVRVPFCDHRLVEYVFNVPWAMKTFDGREKSLLRAAMRGVLPDSVLDRKKNPYPSTQDTTYEVALRERVARLCEPGQPVHQLVSVEGIRRLLDRPVGAYVMGGPWSARAVLERLVEFNTWMTTYNVRLELPGTEGKGQE
ncbi:asparagine synthase (glutamine-hydrolyzing) [Micromonospora sp. KC723]|uniref:asparagine synthase (glutamine-hydrolyzing) n=1 Tax=Micromonospora sp. KC723 TaxID=2530381 RepID=UPI001042AAA2|nr:asparagine synthase (glutamine-hydrolyzing) [Micromonospora sp. KC723]TDB78128.1 asparagine synthase (glutamine-hydrolyzing) [Micromonospora sp. KC723]